MTAVTSIEVAALVEATDEIRATHEGEAASFWGVYVRAPLADWASDHETQGEAFAAAAELAQRHAVPITLRGWFAPVVRT